MTIERAAAEALAERIQSTLADKALDWGEAINRAEAAKGTPNHEMYATIAREHGLELATLSAGIAKKLRPEVR